MLPTACSSPSLRKEFAKTHLFAPTYLSVRFCIVGLPSSDASRLSSIIAHPTRRRSSSSQRWPRSRTRRSGRQLSPRARTGAASAQSGSARASGYGKNSASSSPTARWGRKLADRYSSRPGLQPTAPLSACESSPRPKRSDDSKSRASVSSVAAASGRSPLRDAVRLLFLGACCWRRT